LIMALQSSHIEKDDYTDYNDTQYTKLSKASTRTRKNEGNF